MKDFIQITLLLLIAVRVLSLDNAFYRKLRKKRQIILDTCALIDGRIVELANIGFTPETLVVPQFIIAELQQLADGNDSHKRERARFGLDVVKQLQQSEACEVVIDRTEYTSILETDDKLVALAKKHHAALYTTDYNLYKVADIEGVKVLNVNELAQGLRPVALPGELKQVKILQKGSGRDQGVGYMEDGTMVVVDGAARFIGKEVAVEVSRTFQTAAGKMYFATMKQVPKVERQVVRPKSPDQRLKERLHPTPQRAASREDARRLLGL
jgi:uncharacterized protein YacL